MGNASINRFEWAKAVMQAEGLTATAKNVATALALQFANGETGQINPSQETLADYLKVHRDTVKRVLRELRNAGWLMATGNGGRGKAPNMQLLAPGKIIAFRARKGAANQPAQVEKRGDDLQQKGGQIIPSHYKDEQSLEQRERANADGPPPALLSPIFERFKDHRFIGSAVPGLRVLPISDHSSLNRWAEWLEREGFPKLCHLPISRKAEKGREIYFSLPGKLPPTCEAGKGEARHFFETVLDMEANRHAAQ
ncbi:MAG TPA: hypothetical protein DIT67_06710 [Octadecabacter sp.]|nr:hypothetical protein [Octadecabacter sp.]